MAASLVPTYGCGTNPCWTRSPWTVPGTSPAKAYCPSSSLICHFPARLRINPATSLRSSCPLPLRYISSRNDNPLAVFCLRIPVSSGASKQQSDRAPLPPTTVMCCSLSCCRPQDTCHNTHSHRGVLDALRSGSSLVYPCIPISRQAVEHRP